MYAIDRETDIRRVSSFNAPTLGAGHNKSVAMRIDPRYDALCASRLSWLVIIFVMLHQLNSWALCLMQVFWTSN